MWSHPSTRTPNLQSNNLDAYIRGPYIMFEQNKMCLWNKNVPDNGKDGLGHKDKYLETSRKILSQELLMCNMKALIFII